MSPWRIGRDILRRLLCSAVSLILVLDIEGCGARYGPNDPPSRPMGVPETAFWLRGRELTSKWIDIHVVEANTFDADVYFEAGGIFFSDRFLAPHNLTEPITVEWLKKNIVGVDGHSIFVADKNGQELIFRGINHPYPTPAK